VAQGAAPGSRGILPVKALSQPAGAAVYEVIGYSTDHRLAAYLRGELHIYDADVRHSRSHGSAQ